MRPVICMMTARVRMAPMVMASPVNPLQKIPILNHMKVPIFLKGNAILNAPSVLHP